MNPFYILDLILNISEFLNEEDCIRLCLTSKEVSSVIKSSINCPLFYRLDYSLFLYMNLVTFYCYSDRDFIECIFYKRDALILADVRFHRILQPKIDEHILPECICSSVNTCFDSIITPCLYCNFMRHKCNKMNIDEFKSKGGMCSTKFKFNFKNWCDLLGREDTTYDPRVSS